MVINADQDQFACQSDTDPGKHSSEHNFCDKNERVLLFCNSV